MANTKPKADEVKPKLSKTERLMQELAEAQAKEQERAGKKVAGIKARLENALVSLAKAQDRVAGIEAELAEAKGPDDEPVDFNPGNE